MYILSPDCYSAMFAVPASVADEYLTQASLEELKVLLWIFRNQSSGISVDALTGALGISADSVLCALDFWVSKGILQFQDERGNVRFIPKAQAQKPAEEKKVNSPAPALAVPKKAPAMETEVPVLPKPTMEQIAARMQEDATVRSLMTQAQQILGRTIGLDMQTTLLTLFDTYGLQKEVILTLLQHLAEQGRASTANIAKIGKIWFSREIETLDDANAYIQRISAVEKLFGELKTVTGISTPRPTQKQSEYLLSWLDMGFSLEMLMRAYEETAERTGKISFNYMDRILKNWHNDGIKTPQDIENARKQTAKAKQEKAQQETSFDLDAALRKATVSAKKHSQSKKAE